MEAARPQVVEHRLPGGLVFGADAVQPDGEADVDVAQVAEVFGDRPHVGAGPDPSLLARDRRHGLSGGVRQAGDHAGGVIEPSLRIAHPAGGADMVLAGQRGQRRGHGARS
ncbi:hypothetical protein A9X05_00770 [Mycobacterium sp. E3298]|nr:hypothetical protein A9X05_00770 [Mycobacterium sp. E3298]